MGSKRGVLRGKYNTIKKIHKCEKCNIVYKRKSTLDQHNMSKHTAHAPSAPCPICLNSYKSVSLTNRHIKNVHKMDSSLFKVRIVLTEEKSTQFNFQGVSKFIAIEKNEKLGTHIIASNDIKKGQTIMLTTPFASIKYLTSIDKRCFTCGKSHNSHSIQCDYCHDLWFCDHICASSKTHKSKCDKKFRKTDTFKVRLATELIKTAFSSVESPKQMAGFCESVLTHKLNTRKNKPPYSEYGEIIQLKGSALNNDESEAERVTEFVMNEFHMSVNRKLISKIALLHIRAISVNVFGIDMKIQKGMLKKYMLFSILSRFNHSCASNVINYIETYEGIVSECKTNRHVKKGEQLCINYLGGSAGFTSQEQRQTYLENHWNFKCRCEKCRN